MNGTSGENQIITAMNCCLGEQLGTARNEQVTSSCYYLKLRSFFEKQSGLLLEVTEQVTQVRL